MLARLKTQFSNWRTRRRLQRTLDEYIETLSPKQQEWARSIAVRLAKASTPEAKAQILLSSCNNVSESLHRLTEKVDALDRSLGV